MSTSRRYSAIVERSRLQTKTERGFTIHRYQDRNNESEKEERWKTGKLLGRGTFGNVFLQTLEGDGGLNGNVRAVKYIYGDENTRRRIDWLRELEAMVEFSHKASEDYFVRSFGWYGDPWKGKIFITMEYLEHGDLRYYLADSTALPEVQAKEICFQLSGGLRFMHDKNFAHRDLKPENIMIQAKPPARWWVKIGDFGFSKRVDIGLGSSSVKGTEAYMAPELRAARRQNSNLVDSKPADLWALGEIMHRMMTKKPVFESDLELLRYMEETRDLPLEILIDLKCEPYALSLFSKLMARSPEKRITANETYWHEWMGRLRPPPSPMLDSDDVYDMDLHELDLAQDFSSPSGIWSPVPSKNTFERPSNDLHRNQTEITNKPEVMRPQTTSFRPRSALAPNYLTSSQGSGTLLRTGPMREINQPGFAQPLENHGRGSGASSFGQYQAHFVPKSTNRESIPSPSTAEGWKPNGIFVSSPAPKRPTILGPDGDAYVPTNPKYPKSEEPFSQLPSNYGYGYGNPNMYGALTPLLRNKDLGYSSGFPYPYILYPHPIIYEPTPPTSSLKKTTPKDDNLNGSSAQASEVNPSPSGQAPKLIRKVHMGETKDGNAVETTPKEAASIRTQNNQSEFRKLFMTSFEYPIPRKERKRVERRSQTMIKKDKETRIKDLKDFAASFQLKTPIPDDIVPILARNKAKQDQISKNPKGSADSRQQGLNIDKFGVQAIDGKMEIRTQTNPHVPVGFGPKSSTEKRIRALEKKLKAIERLKEKSASGERLQEDEMIKLGSELSLRDELLNLRTLQAYIRLSNTRITDDGHAQLDEE